MRVCGILLLYSLIPVLPVYRNTSIYPYTNTTKPQYIHTYQYNYFHITIWVGWCDGSLKLHWGLSMQGGITVNAGENSGQRRGEQQSIEEKNITTCMASHDTHTHTSHTPHITHNIKSSHHTNIHPPTHTPSHTCTMAISKHAG